MHINSKNLRYLEYLCGILDESQKEKFLEILLGKGNGIDHIHVVDDVTGDENGIDHVVCMPITRTMIKKAFRQVRNQKS